ncbi:DUF3775 domain-containing protein [Aquicella lusitana]|uniref:Uncharacterized protein DUF3775 n=1 Tax=Aquicella lusitana TaxID=254246 RepID=A0A370GHW7_9COXI|nr:DUF3775 domain-containing protein [Aquicella lusitana]RDI43382.1 uncharacterized protein DUF3775 [Aquicella lusitana]VVC73532.1 hypothetical protein AQULUS_12750 [Aquicella lusitana]
MLNTNVLNINPETVCFIILKAKEFQAKEEVTFNEKIPDSEYEYDWSQILADHEDDLTYLEVKKVIEDLEPDQQVDLLTLMYIGRGDFDPNEWSAAHKEAKNNLAPNLTGYLLSKPLIAGYLEKGLEALGYTCQE